MPNENSPATIPEITIAVSVLFRQLRKPPGIKAEDRTEGYIMALTGFPLWAIEAAVARVLRREVPSIKNPDFCPLPPVLAEIVRDVAPNAGPPRAGQEAAKPAKKLFGYKPPNSKIIEAHCTRDWARQLVDQGVHPRGSIWCPGGLNERPDIGDLYGPDPDWTPAVPWPPISDVTHPVEAELSVNRTPMFATDWVRKMRTAGLPVYVAALPPPPPAPRQIPDYSQDKVEVSEPLQRSMDQRKAMDEAARAAYPPREGGT